MSNNRLKLNLLACTMAVVLLSLMAYALQYLLQSTTAQSSNDFNSQIIKSSILNKLSLNNKTDSNRTLNVINTIDSNATSNFRTYQNSTYGITIQYPSDWTYVGHGPILQPPTQPIVTFTPIEPSDSTLVRIMVTPLTVEGQEQKPSLSQIAERTIELNQQTLSDFKLNNSNPITLKDGTPAHMLSYNYTDPDFGMTGAIDIFMIKGDNLYLIEYFAEPMLYPVHLPKFQTMLDSFEVMRQ